MPAVTAPIDRLRQALRFRVGNPDDEEMNETELTYFLETALNQINKDDPAKKIGSFETVSGQSSYAEVPDDAYRVTEVFYYPGGTDSGTPFGSDVSFSELYAAGGSFDSIGAGASIFDNPAMVEIFHKKLTSFRRYFSGVGGQRLPADDGTIWLAPTPCSVCTVWFVYTAARFATLALVEEYWEQPLLIYAEHLALKSLALKQGGIVASESAGGGSWRSDGGRMHQSMSDQALVRYQREFMKRPIGPRFGP